MKHHLPFESRSQCAAGKVWGSNSRQLECIFPVHHHEKKRGKKREQRWAAATEAERNQAKNATSGTVEITQRRWFAKLHKVMTLFIRSSLWETQWCRDLPSGATLILFLAPGSCSSLQGSILKLIIMYVWPPRSPPTNPTNPWQEP